MFKTNPFSNNTYTTIGDVMVDQNGKTFVKSGDNWIAQNGDLIQQTNNGFLNHRSGINENFGDPFGEKNEY